MGWEGDKGNKKIMVVARDDNRCEIYRQMVRRCYSDKSKDYIRYGKRGIRVCDRWLDKTRVKIWEKGQLGKHWTE